MLASIYHLKASKAAKKFRRKQEILIVQKLPTEFSMDLILVIQTTGLRGSIDG
jgi:hypothetical protein